MKILNAVPSPSFVISFLLALSFYFVGASNKHEENNLGWKAGVAKVIITPDQPMWMAGYASRTGPAEGKLHDLWAKALALEDADGNRSILITTDLVGIPKEISDTVRDRLMKKYGFSRAQIILNSSHTHSGPVLNNAMLDIYPLDSNQLELIKQYSDGFEDKIVSLVGTAIQALQPVQIFADNGVSRFQVNRRNNNESSISQQTTLNGPNDYAVPVLKIINEQSDLLAVVFGYACHATVLDINKWSGDYPGFAQLELEKSHPGSMALFFQGAGGDQNPLPRRSVALAQQYGRDLAAAVDRVLNEDMRALQPQLKSAYSEIELSLEKPHSKKQLKEIGESPIDFKKIWAKNLLAKIENGESIVSTLPYPIQLWQLGDQTIVSLGGEPVIEYATNLKSIFGKDTFVMGYSNDVMAYIPTTTILEEGGYEGYISQMAYGLPNKWKSTIETTILNEIVGLSEQSGIGQAKVSKQEILDKDRVMLQHRLDKSPLLAKRYFSGFDDAHDTYNAISAASNGKIYYVLSSAKHDKGGEMHVYDPKTDKTEFLADLTEICGEKNAKAISQGKSHVRFYESNGVLYFTTHIGFYEFIDGSERLPVTPPKGYDLYPGGHIISYDLSSGEFKDLAKAPDGDGIITMTMDKDRGHIYGITWPKGYFVHYDLNKNTMENLGKISANGEAGTPGDDYRVICRSMFVDHRDGLVYFSTSEGDIFSYSPFSRKIDLVKNVNLRLDYFGQYGTSDPGNMGYNWRKIEWRPTEGVAYGVHGNSGYLFRFDPHKPKIELVDRITSEPSRKSGMFDYFSYGYLGFQLGPDEQTLYYLTGGPIYVDGQREKGEHISMGGAKGLENLHLITYHIPSEKYTDHGAVFYGDGERPTYVNSIAVGPNGNIYTLARFERNGKIIEDLVKIPNPF